MALQVCSVKNFKDPARLVRFCLYLNFTFVGNGYRSTHKDVMLRSHGSCSGISRSTHTCFNSQGFCEFCSCDRQLAHIAHEVGVAQRLSRVS